MEQAITLMIVEDNKAYAKTLLDTIELSQDMETLGHFHSAETCLATLVKPESSRPEVLLLDLNLPGENGLTMLPFLKKASPETEVIILTQNNDYHTVLQTIQLGAVGYILKGATIAVIRETIREVHAGSSYIDPQLSRMVLDTLCHGDSPAENPLSPGQFAARHLLALFF
jgi:DNA-binding NarL/FixJ family response regulator